MSEFEEKFRLAKIVLSKLENGDRRWTELIKLTLRDYGTPAKFQSILYFLLKHDYVVRVKRGIYQITEKGLNFLRLL